MAKFKVGDRVKYRDEMVFVVCNKDSYHYVIERYGDEGWGRQFLPNSLRDWISKAGDTYWYVMDSELELVEYGRSVPVNLPYHLHMDMCQPGQVIYQTSDWCTGWSRQEIMSRAIEYKNKPFMSSIKEQFVLAFKSEPEKSFRIKGITNGDDMLTSDGQQIFLSWLLKKNGEAFKAEVVDAIKEDK